MKIKVTILGCKNHKSALISVINTQPSDGNYPLINSTNSRITQLAGSREFSVKGNLISMKVIALPCRHSTLG